MKFHKTLAAAALTAAFVIPFSSLDAGAVDTTSLTVVDADQFSGTNLLSHTICVDDELVQSGRHVINDAIETTPGTHTVKVARGPFTGDPAFDCDDPAPNTPGWVSSEVDLADVEAQTLVYKGFVEDTETESKVLDMTLFTDDMGCAEPDTGRIVARNFSYAGLPVNFGSSDGAATDPELTPLISGLDFGDEGTAVVDAGTFPADAGSVAAGWVEGTDTPHFSDFDSIDAAAGSVTYVYAVGGGDGPIGQYAVTTDGSVCDVEESTTTTVAPEVTTTTVPATPAPAAAPVAAQPTYTG